MYTMRDHGRVLAALGRKYVALRENVAKPPGTPNHKLELAERRIIEPNSR